MSALWRVAKNVRFQDRRKKGSNRNIINIRFDSYYEPEQCDDEPLAAQTDRASKKCNPTYRSIWAAIDRISKFTANPQDIGDKQTAQRIACLVLSFWGRPVPPTII